MAHDALRPVKCGLFKYFPTDEFHLTKFAKQQVLLTPPKYFNDPWDFLVRRETPSDEELRLLFESFENEAGRTAKVRSEDSNRRFQEFRERVTSGDFLAGEAGHMQDRLSAAFGVVCLAGDPLSRLMWAHYANSYRGFVAEFKCSGETEFRGRPARQTPFGPALKVVYGNTWPQIRKDFENVSEVCSTKYADWQNEDEWRVILPLTQQAGLPEIIHEPKDGKLYYLLTFRPEDLVRVFWFEQRVSDEVKEQLEAMIAANPHVQRAIVKINQTSGEFELLGD
jgi:hypothetical protein